nr:LOW QUALITY PROTEIN: uncharacterized protein LOC128698011 [Cherax quadricarinatus]
MATILVCIAAILECTAHTLVSIVLTVVYIVPALVYMALTLVSIAFTLVSMHPTLAFYLQESQSTFTRLWLLTSLCKVRGFTCFRKVCGLTCLHRICSFTSHSQNCGFPTSHTQNCGFPTSHTQNCGFPTSHSKNFGFPTSHSQDCGSLTSHSQDCGFPTSHSQTVAPSPLTLETVASPPLTLKTVAPSPLTLKTVASPPLTLKTVAPAPLTYNVAPLAHVTSVKSQYHAQDELGQYAFGYSGGPSSRAETRDVFGIVRGSYNYIDSDGKIQARHYVADANGFRVAGTNIPVAPEIPVQAIVPGPENTAEIVNAEVAFKMPYKEVQLVPLTSLIPSSNIQPCSFQVLAHTLQSTSLNSSHTCDQPGRTTAAVTDYTATHALGYAASAPVAADLCNQHVLLRLETNPVHAIS